MTLSITAVLCTARKEPQFQWIADSYTRALEHCPYPVELIVVDKLLWVSTSQQGERSIAELRREDLAEAVSGRFSYRHVPPKPSPWQGPWRKTPRDHFALCNARNTALAIARGSYVCFFDDCTVLDEDYFYNHALAAVRNVAMAGSFKGWNKAKVVNGQVIEGELHPMGNDQRGNQVLLAPGGWFYGLCCGAPLEAFLQVNGYDEKYDGAGGSEDCDLGVRLQRAGTKIIYNPKCLIHQILTTHEPVCEYETWGNPQPARGPKERVLEADGIPHFANEWLIQELVKDSTRTEPLGNEFNLRVLHEKALREGYLAFSTEFALEEDWRDGALLSTCL